MSELPEQILASIADSLASIAYSLAIIASAHEADADPDDSPTFTYLDGTNAD